MGKKKLNLQPAFYRYLLIILFLIISASNNYSQWLWQNPLPQGNDIQSIAFADSLNGFAGGKEIYMRTTDGGIHWSIQNSPTSGRIINKIYFLNDKKSFFCLNFNELRMYFAVGQQLHAAFGIVHDIKI